MNRFGYLGVLKERILSAYFWVTWSKGGRFEWVRDTSFGRRVPHYEDGAPETAGKKYSLDNFKVFNPLPRVRWPLLVLAGIPNIETSTARILIVGPRFLTEYFLARALGFAPQNILMVDLLPMNKRVIRGDMHRLPFDDNLFDGVICGWTLSYSLKPDKALKELLRVTKRNGYVVFGVEKAAPASIATVEGLLEGRSRVQTRSQFKKLAEPSVVEAFFDSEYGGDVLAVIRK